MSILNRPSDGLVSVLISIYKVLAEHNALSRDDIKNIIAPGNVPELQVSQTLTRWTQLGLFDKNESTYSINTSYAPKLSQLSDDSLRHLPTKLHSIVFKKENNENFWDAANSKSADFSRGISWLLAQDVYSFPTNSHKTVAKIEGEQIDLSMQMLQNDTRWVGLCQWAEYLGFAWGSKTLVIDPTVAIRENLPAIFSGYTTMTATLFLETLAKILPVIDFGDYRQKVEDILNQQVWSRPPKLFLSTSLSRAMKRLELSGHLSLEYQSDTGESYRLLRQQTQEWGRSFTHVSWLKSEDQ